MKKSGTYTSDIFVPSNRVQRRLRFSKNGGPSPTLVFQFQHSSHFLPLKTQTKNIWTRNLQLSDAKLTNFAV